MCFNTKLIEFVLVINLLFYTLAIIIEMSTVKVEIIIMLSIIVII